VFLKIEHTLAFAYDGYISESFIELRVQPKATAGQTVASFSLAIGPPTRVFRYRDWNDNLAHHFTVTKFHDRITVESRSLVDVHPVSPPLASVTDALLVARHADMTVFVVQHNKIDKKLVKRQVTALRKATPNLLGAVLNAVDVKAKGYYYYYYQQDTGTSGKGAASGKGVPPAKGPIPVRKK
jgi:transglutaminase-like putative cysteine protease